MDAMTEYERWETNLAKINLPKWDELPNFDLYMDQVVAYVNNLIGSMGLDLVTPAMINNYVKHKAILAPIKKKYQVMHIADILVISLLKATFPIDVIRSGMDQVTLRKYPKQAYDHFVELLMARLRKQPVGDTKAKSINENLMEVAVESVVTKLKAEELLRMMEKTGKPQSIKKVKQ
ncbi:DUF1836 domain-containing protein [Paucilactobacillus wasatchensis]|uniref:BS_ykrK family protein n=1 Tax=Paucilactobacillus wasatchensis TaxID=1335616 RepID=A0A0D0Y503_9LACO|nr:DUF1836 domain-containing protein [Paucilactobacillus wasatchensis]KIS03373.1 hypothetical protein WDC_1007 [Paucilactobacillus wasatchensis]